MTKEMLGMGILLIALGASAQLPEMMGSLAIQGTLTQQSVQTAQQGINQVNYTQLVQQLQLLVMEIRTSFMNGYQHLSQSALQTSLPSGVSWEVFPMDNRRFQIILHHVDRSSCLRLSQNPIGAEMVQVNGQISSSCGNDNRINFIFK